METIKWGPFIVAENPALKPDEVLILDEKMLREISQKIAYAFAVPAHMMKGKDYARR